MATWYSIKNQLEGGYVKASNELERFFTSLVTSYGCIDIWYRNISSESNIIECRIFYLQKDSTFNASDLGRALNSWERVNERPKYWLQLEGTVSEIRASVVSFLPQLSRLHNEKRHGEWNFGADQPFEGQGTLISTDGSGNTIITGRFGDILLNSDGESIDWEDITWSFDGCNPTATAPPADQVCLVDPGTLIKQCQPVGDDLGTCVCGECCGDYTASLITQADCTAAGCSDPNSQWIADNDLTSFTSDRWNNYFSCPDCTGTCVTGNCTDGFTATYPVTEANCTGHWYRGQDLSGQSAAYWEGVFGCGQNIELGCCVIGTDCFNWDVSVTTSAGCTTRASQLGLPVDSFTDGKLAKNGCTLADIRDELGCLDVPGALTITVTYKGTCGACWAPGVRTDQFPVNDQWSRPFWYQECDYVFPECQGDTEFIPAITPGSNYTPPDLYNEFSGCTGFNFPEDCESVTYDIEDDTFTKRFGQWQLTGWTPGNAFATFDQTYTYVFDRDTGYNGNDESVQRYYLRDTTVQRPQWNNTWSQVTLEKTCCNQDLPRVHYQPNFTWNAGISSSGDGTANTPYDILRFVSGGKTNYVGGIPGVTFGQGPSANGWGAEIGRFNNGWYDFNEHGQIINTKGKLGWSIPLSEGPGTVNYTFGLNTAPQNITFGGQYYNAMPVITVESYQVTATVAES